MASPGPLEVEVRYRDERGGWVCGQLADVDAGAVVLGQPVRSFPTYKDQANYPGWLWSATMGRLIGYESLLERDRLWLADFDPTVSRIASQPLWMSGRDGGVPRRHVPDFLLRTETGFVVVDVKPERMLADPRVSAALDWAGRVCAAKGWRFEVWSGADPVVLRNVRFLAAGRRTDPREAVLVKVAETLKPGMSMAEAEQASGLDRSVARGALLSLLWRGSWVTDLTRPLSDKSLLTPSERAA